LVSSIPRITGFEMPVFNFAEMLINKLFVVGSPSLLGAVKAFDASVDNLIK